ncbi:PD-(D/E)XK motif protein [Mumia zhuanghuii]|uniref:PD-(D/E)XK motif protein n=2 Tax=Mumia TaxID=1546255 RepID=A0ABW1QNR4_9ACTN|nr:MULTISPECIES: PD-(D/E)XK motif protein [Mumia]KAA1420686.1 PD-(D/E)XK motif protein [Mumia zhuanghuii]
MSDTSAEFAPPASFEWLRDEIADLERSRDAASRELLWADEGHRLAVSRDPRGAVELFLPGPPLEPVLPQVSAKLDHDAWTTKGGEPLAASRIVLPDAPHFDAVAAFLAAELLERGLVDDREGAFRATEPIIALAISRAEIQNQVLLGLVGELVALLALVRAAPSAAAAEIVGGWAGSFRSNRDLQVRTVGVEVKTTTGAASHHHIQSPLQVTLGHARDGQPETALYLLSLGIRWQPSGSGAGMTLPELVEDLLARLPSEDGEDLLARIKQYGGDAATGYDHARDRLRSRYRHPFRLTFERLYDVVGDDLRLPQVSDFDSMSAVDAATVSFEVNLPPQVRGDRNPVVGLPDISRTVLAESAVGVRQA